VKEKMEMEESQQKQGDGGRVKCSNGSCEEGNKERVRKQEKLTEKGK
jgi:hypothetical protein